MSYVTMVYTHVCNSPFSDNLKFSEWISDKSVNNSLNNRVLNCLEL